MSSAIVDPTLVISSTILGSVLASFCLGFIVSQYTKYKRSIIKDKPVTRWAVGLSVLLCIATCALILVCLWQRSVNFDTATTQVAYYLPVELAFFATSATTILITQAHLATQTYRLLNRSRLAAATLWLGGLASIAGAIGLIVVANRGDVTLSQARAFLYTLSGGICFTALAITVCATLALQNKEIRQSRKSEHLLGSFYFNNILITLLSITQLVLIVLSVTKIYMALLAVLPQLYTISMLRSLNSRRELRLGAEAEARSHFNYEDEEKQTEDLFDVQIIVEGEDRKAMEVDRPIQRRASSMGWSA